MQEVTVINAELDLLNFANERKAVWLALFRGSVRVCLVCYMQG